jgi:hypothetical protein
MAAGVARSSPPRSRRNRVGLAAADACARQVGDDGQGADRIEAGIERARSASACRYGDPLVLRIEHDRHRVSEARAERLLAATASALARMSVRLGYPEREPRLAIEPVRG